MVLLPVPSPDKGGGFYQQASSLLFVKTQLAKKPNKRLGTTDGSHGKRHKLRKRTLNIGTWNVQGIRTKEDEITRELQTLSMDLVVLTETKKKGTGTEVINNYVHVYSGVPKHQRAKRGVSVMIHKKYRNKITDFEFLSENIIRININIHQRPVTILGIYAISDDEPISVKEEFFEQVHEEIGKIGKTRELVVLGDFNSRIGRKINDSVVGPFGELNVNDNGERLIEMCKNNQLKITNGFYKHKDIHTFTWVQHTRNLRSVIDYVIVKQVNTMQINDVRAYRGVTCGSDHYMVRAKILFPYAYTPKVDRKDQAGELEKIDEKNYNLDSLTHESTQQLYCSRLDEKLLDRSEWEQKPVEEVHENLVRSIKEAAMEAIGVKGRARSTNIWWNKDIEDLITQKKRLYQRWTHTRLQQDKDLYLEKKRITRQTIANAKREMWDRKCQEINMLIGGRKCSESWKFIKKIRSNGKNSANIQLIPTTKWIEHYEKLLTEDRDQYLATSPTEVSIVGETVSIDVAIIKRAVKMLKNGRAAGPEGIPAELIKSGSDKLFEMIAWCMNQYLNGNPIPDEWKVAHITSIHKKGNKLDCSNYRGISVTSTLSRLYGRVLRDLIEIEYGEQEEEEQSGFRAGRSCVDNVFCLKQIIEKRSNTNMETHLLFVDLRKAYDTVPVKMLWKALEETNISYTLIKALKNLYDGSTSRIKIGNNVSRKFNVDRGLRQGCCISPTLFKIYVARALKQWKKKCSGMGIDLGEKCLYTLQFADDQVLIANDKDDLEYMARKLHDEYKMWGLDMNTEKTKYLPIGAPPQNIQLEKEEIETCTEYTYLGVEFDSTGKDDKEIKKRITQARRTIGCLNGIWWSSDIGRKQKYTIYETFVKSALIYGAETWRITENNRRKLEATEMDVFRRSVRVSRRDRVRNEDIRRRMGVDGSLTTDIERKQLVWYGHVQRMNVDRLPRMTMHWIPPNRRKRGRPKKSWKEGITKAMSDRNLREDQWNDRNEWKLGIGQRRRTF